MPTKIEAWRTNDGRVVGTEVEALELEAQSALQEFFKPLTGVGQGAAIIAINAIVKDPSFPIDALIAIRTAQGK